MVDYPIFFLLLCSCILESWDFFRTWTLDSGLSMMMERLEMTFAVTCFRISQGPVFHQLKASPADGTQALDPALASALRADFNTYVSGLQVSPSVQGGSLQVSPVLDGY